MRDARLLRSVQRRRTLASIEASFIHSGVRFNRVAHVSRDLAERMTDLYLTFEVGRMWDEACTDPDTETSPARAAVGAAPGGTRA